MHIEQRTRPRTGHDPEKGLHGAKLVIELSGGFVLGQCPGVILEAKVEFFPGVLDAVGIKRAGDLATRGVQFLDELGRRYLCQGLGPIIQHLLLQVIHDFLVIIDLQFKLRGACRSGIGLLSL